MNEKVLKAVLTLAKQFWTDMFLAKPQLTIAPVASSSDWWCHLVTPRRCDAATGGPSGWGRPMHPPSWCLRGVWGSGWPLPWRRLYSGHTYSPGSSNPAPPSHSPGGPLLRRARVNVIMKGLI